MLELWEKVRCVPTNAKKEIQAGRLKGKTDINPMWRIKTLTENFGICGFGWKYIITNKQIIDGADGVKSAFVDIDLFIKGDDKWSDAIQGTGGASFVAKESAGLYTSDECFKMALTDAISVACKSLGFGADVYWDKDATKYDKKEATAKAKETAEKVAKEFGSTEVIPPPEKATDEQIAEIKKLATLKGASLAKINQHYKINNLQDICWTDAKHCIDELKKREDKK